MFHYTFCNHQQIAVLFYSQFDPMHTNQTMCVHVIGGIHWIGFCIYYEKSSGNMKRGCSNMNPLHYSHIHNTYNICSCIWGIRVYDVTQIVDIHINLNVKTHVTLLFEIKLFVFLVLLYKIHIACSYVGVIMVSNILERHSFRCIFKWYERSTIHFRYIYGWWWFGFEWMFWHTKVTQENINSKWFIILVFFTAL